MTAQLVATNGRDLATAAPWESKLELIKNTIAKGITDAELELFLYQCKKTGLDPLARQIYVVRRRSGEEYKATIQTGIDGYRLIADRTGLYAGNDDAVFTGEHFVGSEGKEVAAPEQATVTVWKFVHGQRCPFTATARWREYYPGDRQGTMWHKMPYVMLSKCSEALALRKAFPADLSGIYTDTEMAQADNEAPTFQPAQLAPVRDRGVADKARRRIDAEVRPAQPVPALLPDAEKRARSLAWIAEALKELHRREVDVAQYGQFAHDDPLAEVEAYGRTLKAALAETA